MNDEITVKFEALNDLLANVMQVCIDAEPLRAIDPRSKLGQSISRLQASAVAMGEQHPEIKDRNDSRDEATTEIYKMLGLLPS